MKNKEFKISNYLLASKNLRFLNFIIDSVILYLIVMIIVAILDLTIMNNNIPIAFWLDSLDNAEWYIFWAVVSFFYYGLTEIFVARSLAKYFTKTIVVMKDGSKPKIIDVLARSILRQIPFEHFTFLRGRKPGLHDEYSKTFVVKKEKLEKSIREFNELENSNE